MEFPQYPKPSDTLEWFENTKQIFARWEILKSETKLAIVDVLSDWTRKIYLLDDLHIKKQTTCQLEQK